MASDATKQTISQSLNELKAEVANRTNAIVTGVKIPELQDTLLISPTDQLIIETDNGTRRSTLKNFGNYISQGLASPQEVIDARNDGNVNHATLSERLNSDANKIKANAQQIETNKQAIGDLTNKYDLLNEEVEKAREDNQTPSMTHGSLKDRLDSDFNIINNSLRAMYYYVTPEMFGYKKGDIINDSLQKCFDFCKNNDGGTIVVKNGEHLVSGTMIMYKNTRLILEEGAVMICQGATATPINNGLPTDQFTRYNGNGNLYIEGGTWVSNSAGQAESNRNIFGFAHADGITIRNVIFKNVKSSHAIDLNASRNVLIEQCQFLGYKNADDGSRTFSEAIQIAEHSELGFGGVGSFDGTPCIDVTVRNCYFGASDYYGAWGCGVGNHGSIHDKFNENITVEGCVFEGMLHSGVRPFKWNNVTIRNNTFRKCKDGVVVSAVRAGSGSANDVNGTPSNKSQAGKKHYILNNDFIDCSGQAIYMLGQLSALDDIAQIEDVVISGNTVEYSQTPTGSNGCMFLILCKNVQITNNSMKNCSRGIWLRYTSNCSISQNKVIGALYEGLYVNETTGGDFDLLNGQFFSHTVDVLNNTFTDIGRTVINLTKTDAFSIAGNRIKNGCIETVNTRSAISVASGCKNGSVYNNIVEKVADQRNQYGINVTTACSNVLVYDNDCYGVTGSVFVHDNAKKELTNSVTPKWIDCTLKQGVTPYDALYPTPRVRKNRDGLVVVQGTVTHDKAFRGTLLELPSGYAPSVPTFFTTLASTPANSVFENDVKVNRIYVKTNGEVALEATNSDSDTPFTTLYFSFYAG